MRFAVEEIVRHFKYIGVAVAEGTDSYGVVCWCRGEHGRLTDW
jgi:hypothetical protein